MRPSSRMSLESCLCLFDLRPSLSVCPSNFGHSQSAANSGFGSAADLSVAIFPSTDIRYNFIERFVPFDIEIAKQRTNGFLTGIEVDVLLFETANPLYKFKIEGHLAFRFSDTPLIPALKGYTVGTQATQNR